MSEPWEIPIIPVKRRGGCGVRNRSLKMRRRARKRAKHARNKNLKLRKEQRIQNRGKREHSQLMANQKSPLYKQAA